MEVSNVVTGCVHVSESRRLFHAKHDLLLLRVMPQAAVWAAVLPPWRATQGLLSADWLVQVWHSVRLAMLEFCHFVKTYWFNVIRWTLQLFNRVDLIKPVSNVRQSVRAYSVLRSSTKSYFFITWLWSWQKRKLWRVDHQSHTGLIYLCYYPRQRHSCGKGLHCSSSVLLHNISKTNAARITKLDMQMFHDESWKPFILGS